MMGAKKLLQVRLVCDVCGTTQDFTLTKEQRRDLERHVGPWLYEPTAPYDSCADRAVCEPCQAATAKRRT